MFVRRLFGASLFPEWFHFFCHGYCEGLGGWVGRLTASFLLRVFSVLEGNGDDDSSERSCPQFPIDPICSRVFPGDRKSLVFAAVVVRVTGGGYYFEVLSITAVPLYHTHYHATLGTGAGYADPTP